MKKLFFSLLFLSFFAFPGSAFSDDDGWVPGSRTTPLRYKYPVEPFPYGQQSYFYRKCLKSSSVFDSCLSDNSMDQYLELFISANLNSSRVYAIKRWQVDQSTSVLVHAQVMKRSVGDYNSNPSLPDGADMAYGVAMTDKQCNSKYGGSYSMPSSYVNSGQVSVPGCTMVAGDVSVETDADFHSNWSAVSDGQVVNPSGSSTVPLEPGLSDSYTLDPGCSFNCVEYDGKRYSVDPAGLADGSVSIIGPGGVDLTRRETTENYSDGSSRTDHIDGSYTVIDSDNNVYEYNSSGVRTNPDSAPDSPGHGPGGDYSDNDGVFVGDGFDVEFEVDVGEEACPPWICGDEELPNMEPPLPDDIFEAVDFSDMPDFNSGLAKNASCPAPDVINLSLGSYSTQLEFKYDAFCSFADVLRGLVLFASYLSSAFLVYRGVLA